MGGLIAARMGLPVKQFIVSTNENNEVPEFLRTASTNQSLRQKIAFQVQ